MSEVLSKLILCQGKTEIVQIGDYIFVQSSIFVILFDDLRKKWLILQAHKVLNQEPSISNDVMTKNNLNIMLNSRKSKHYKNKFGKQQHKLIRLLDFKIQDGKREYKGEWVAANNEMIIKWTNMKALQNYHLATCCYQSYQKQYIRLHQQLWISMIESREASDPLYNSQVNESLFYPCEKSISQQNDEYNFKDCDFVFGKEKRIQKSINRISKIQKKAKPIANKIERKIKRYPSINNDSALTAMASKVQRIKNERGLIDLSPKQADKSTGQPFSPYSLNDSEQAAFPNQQGEILSNCYQQQSLIGDLDVKPKQHKEIILEVLSGNQQLQQNDKSISKERKINHFQSQQSISQSNNQPSYIYQPQASVDSKLNFKQLKQLIKINLNLPYNNIQILQQPKIQSSKDQLKNQFKINQRQSLQVQIKIQQNCSIQNCNQYEEFKPQINSEELFKHYFQERVLKDQKDFEQIYEIKGLFNIENTKFFEVNIGNSYYEQLRFISYQSLKLKHKKLLRNWLKSQNLRTKN